MLLDAGANVNAQNNNGLTALHMSVEYDYYFTSKVLVDASADGEIASGEVSPRSTRRPSAPYSTPPLPLVPPVLTKTARSRRAPRRPPALRGRTASRTRPRPSRYARPSPSPSGFLALANRPPFLAGRILHGGGRACAGDGEGQPGGVSQAARNHIPSSLLFFAVLSAPLLTRSEPVVQLRQNAVCAEVHDAQEVGHRCALARSSHILRAFSTFQCRFPHSDCRTRPSHSLTFACVRCNSDLYSGLE